MSTMTMDNEIQVPDDIDLTGIDTLVGLLAGERQAVETAIHGIPCPPPLVFTDIRGGGPVHDAERWGAPQVKLTEPQPTNFPPLWYAAAWTVAAYIAAAAGLGAMIVMGIRIAGGAV